MKKPRKLKLLTSLSCLGILTAAAPIVMTACSDTEIKSANGMVFDGKVYEIADNVDLNAFCWVPTFFSETEYFMSIPLKNGKYFNITMDNRFDLTKLKITSINKDIDYINNDFLSYLPNLKELTISDYSHITEIGDRFLVANTLETVDISTFTNMKLIGDDFLAMSYNLEGPDIIDPVNGYTKLSTIGMHFLAGCPNLTVADLTSFPNTNLKIGEGMYSDCYLLNTIHAGTITPEKMGYDKWTQSQTAPYTWTLERESTPTEDIETFTSWFLSETTEEKKQSLHIDILCPDQAAVDTWNAAAGEQATPVKFTPLENREWVDEDTGTVMYGTRNISIGVEK